MSLGNALRDVLYGNWNPSGKLPYTIARNASDYSGSIVTDSDPVCKCILIVVPGDYPNDATPFAAIKQVPYTER